MTVYNINKQNVSRTGFIKNKPLKRGIVVFWSPYCQYCVKKKPLFKSFSTSKSMNVYMFQIAPGNDVDFINVKNIPEVHFVNSYGKISKSKYSGLLTKNALLQYIRSKSK